MGMDFLLILIGVDVLLGSAAVFVAYRRLPAGFTRTFVTSLLLAVFFSFSVIVYRIVVLPMPTFVVLVALAADWYKAQTTPCVLHPTEGCIPPMEDDATVVMLIPVLAQWAIWFLVVSVVERFRRSAYRHGDSQVPTAQE
jgi:hypothetical protein